MTWRHTSCCKPNGVSLQNSHVEVQPPVERIRLDEVIKVGPWCDRISILIRYILIRYSIRRDTRELFLSLSLYVFVCLYAHTREGPCDRTARKLLSASQGGGSHETLNQLEFFWSWNSSLQICEKKYFCCLDRSIVFYYGSQSRLIIPLAAARDEKLKHCSLRRLRGGEWWMVHDLPVLHYPTGSCGEWGHCKSVP